MCLRYNIYQFCVSLCESERGSNQNQYTIRGTWCIFCRRHYRSASFNLLLHLPCVKMTLLEKFESSAIKSLATDARCTKRDSLSWHNYMPKKSNYSLGDMNRFKRLYDDFIIFVSIKPDGTRRWSLPPTKSAPLIPIATESALCSRYPLSFGTVRNRLLRLPQ